MSALVVDASVAASAVEGRTPDARKLLARLQAADVNAPHLIDAEVGHVLRRRVASGQLRPEHAAGALHAMESLVTHRYAHAPLARAAWALRENVSYYDALYVALASRLDTVLLTADLRLANAPGLPCTIEAIRLPPAPASSRSS